MNVGSILNDDTPSDIETKNPVIANIQKSPQRNSIVSLLNDDKSDATPEPLSTKDAEEPQVNNDEQKQVEESTSNSGDKSQLEEDEITRLNKLKSKDKPKRYKVPPVWAQEWIPTKRRNPNDILVNNPLEPSIESLSDKSIFNTSTTSSVDLECSITGIIPPASITRTIAEWIYANFIEINQSTRPFVELELKFGTIMDKKLNSRLNINVSTECIYTDTSNIYFDPGIHEVGFNEMMNFFEELEKSYQEENKKNPSKPKRKFNILESDVTDFFYYIRNRNEAPKTVRVSKDNKLNPPRYSAINKVRKSDLFIHNPSSMYDLRLSLSIENPVENDQIEPMMKKTKPQKTRIKQRNSFNHKPTVTRFDLTRVTEPKELKSATTGKKIIENEKSFEVELEADVLELFSGFDQVKDGTNTIRFEELIEIFVNNARCLNNRITKIAK